MTETANETSTYDHSLKSAVTIASMVVAIAAIVSGVLHYRDEHGTVPWIPRIAFVVAIVIMYLMRRPRWQLNPDGLLDLLTKKRILFAAIENVRVVKSSDNGAKTFGILAAGKEHRIDVLQGDAFSNDLGKWIGTRLTSAEPGKLMAGLG